MELYDRITFCKLDVKSSCVRVGIHKRVAGLWPRLLRVHRRPAWLTVNAGNSIMDSSDDEGDSDCEDPLKLVTRMYTAISLVSLFDITTVVRLQYIRFFSCMITR